MYLSPESYAEICKQSAFISALVAGFSFAFLGVLLVSSVRSRIIDWVIVFSTFSIAGLLICSLVWTLSASRMALYTSGAMKEVPQQFLKLHRELSVVFIAGFFFFLLTLGLSGWIRSKLLGFISGLIALVSVVFFIVIMGQFIV